MSQPSSKPEDNHELCPKPPPTFVREATGLVRGLTWFDGMIMGLAAYNIAVASFIIFGWGSYLFPGSDMVITIAFVGPLLVVPVLVVYSMFSSSMPRTGGEYVYVSRSLSAPFGFSLAMVLLIFQATFSVGQNAWFLTTTVLGPELAAIGSTTSNSSLVNLANYITSNLWATLSIGILALLLVFFLLLIPTSKLHRVMGALFIISFIGWPIIYVVGLATSSNASFISAFNSYAVHNGLNTSYNGIIAAAQKAGATIAAPSFAASLTALPIYFATLGFPQNAIYPAGETKRASRQVPIALAAGLIVAAISTAMIGAVTYNVFGYNFLSAAGFYGFSGASGYPLLALPYANYFFAILYPNAALNWFMLLSAATWTTLLMITYGIMATRITFAVSFDRIFPTAFADVSERFHTPIKATILAMLGAFVFLAFTAESFLLAYFELIVAVASVFIFVMVAAAVYPVLRPTLFQQSPKWVTRKIGSIPLMSIFGALGVLTMLVIFYYAAADPSVSGFTISGLLVIIAVYIISIGVHYVIRAVRRGQGINLALVYKEIPPE